MMETCKCGQNKLATETDGRYAYQYCIECKDIITVLYLGPKPEIDEEGI